MGDVDHGVGQPLVQPLDLDAQLGAQFGVEVGQRLVEQEDVDVAHQRTTDRHTLALPAGQLRGLAIQQRLDLQDLGGARHAFLDLRLRHARRLQAERQIAPDRHLRIERVGLEHHADAAILRLLPGDVLALDDDAAGGNVEQACNTVEQGRLAAAGRAQQDEEFAVADVEIERLQHGNRPEAERQVSDGDADAVRIHAISPSPRPRRCRARTVFRKGNRRRGGQGP